MDIPLNENVNSICGKFNVFNDSYTVKMLKNWKPQLSSSTVELGQQQKMVGKFHLLLNRCKRYVKWSAASRCVR